MSQPPVEAEDPAVAVEPDALVGARFISRFEARAHRHRLHPSRLWRLVLGLALLAFGVVNIFIPGPGGSVIILASLLILAGESRTLARLLDYGEMRFERQVRWALEHKVVAAVLISGTALAVVSGATLLVRNLR